MLQSVARPAAADDLPVVTDLLTVLEAGGAFEVFTVALSSPLFD